MALGLGLHAAGRARGDAACGRICRIGAPGQPVARLSQGALANALNPKVAIFFLAFLPQFIDAAAPHQTLAFLVLGAWFIVQG